MDTAESWFLSADERDKIVALAFAYGVLCRDGKDDEAKSALFDLVLEVDEMVSRAHCQGQGLC
jgi:hypothetical protein